MHVETMFQAKGSYYGYTSVGKASHSNHKQAYTHMHKMQSH